MIRSTSRTGWRNLPVRGFFLRNVDDEDDRKTMAQPIIEMRQRAVVDEPLVGLLLAYARDAACAGLDLGADQLSRGKAAGIYLFNVCVDSHVNRGLFTKYPSEFVEDYALDGIDPLSLS